MSTALLIIDVQQALCEGEYATLDAQGVIARINAISTQARAQGVPVIVVQHEEHQAPMQHGSPGWQLPETLSVSAQDIYVRKTTPDSFNKTDLQAQLEARGITRLITCGMQSDFCVDTTVRQALSRGYDVVLVKDGHTSVDNGVLTARQIIDHHNVTFANMTSFGPRIKVLPAAEVRL